MNGPRQPREPPRRARCKSENATRRADQAIRQLINDGERITFRSVARTDGCSIDFVYSNPDIRARIEHLRAQRQDSPPDRAPETTRA